MICNKWNSKKKQHQKQTAKKSSLFLYLDTIVIMFYLKLYKFFLPFSRWFSSLCTKRPATEMDIFIVLWWICGNICNVTICDSLNQSQWVTNLSRSQADFFSGSISLIPISCSILGILWFPRIRIFKSIDFYWKDVPSLTWHANFNLKLRWHKVEICLPFFERLR